MILTLALACSLGVHSITLAGRVDPPPEQIAAARIVGGAIAFVHVAESPGDWRSFALAHDSTVTWPPLMRLCLIAGADTAEAVEQFAMTAPFEAVIIPVGGAYPMQLNPSELWRKRFRGGSVSTVLFARFPATKGTIAGVCIRRHREGR